MTSGLPRKLATLALAVFAMALLPHLVIAKPSDTLKRRMHSDPQFSPDGKHLAVLIKDNEGNKQLAVRNIANASTRVSLVTSPDAPEWDRKKSIEAYRWVDNENIVAKSNWEDDENALSHVKVGGNVPRYLRSNSKYTIIVPMYGSSRYLVAQRPAKDEMGSCRVLELDIKDRRFEKVLYSCEAKTFEAYTDREGNLKLIKKDEDNKLAWHVLDESSGAWKQLSLNPWITFYGFDYNPDTIWVGGFFGDPHPGIYLYSLSQDKPVSRFATHPDYSIDLIGTPLFSESIKGVMGMHLDAAIQQTEWIHAKPASYQKQIDALFTDSSNRIIAWSSDLAKVVVERNFRDRPPQAFLIDFSTQKVEFLYANGKTSEGDRASPTEHVKIENRDGVAMDAFFTPPIGGKSSAPLVIMLRSDPWGSMDHLQWNGEDQFFAANGYAVARLNFRGSKGYRGNMSIDWQETEDALKVIQDLEDLVAWIEENGKADTQRTAIVTMGSGGWIASYSSIASPNTFKAIVCNSGIYDLVDYVDTNGKDPIRYMVGNIPFAKVGNGLSQDDLRELSPTNNISKLTSAFFVSYGKYSPTRYSNHASRFVKAARKAGAKVEKPYVGEWYGKDIGNDETYETYYKKVAAFLKKNL